MPNATTQSRIESRTLAGNSRCSRTNPKGANLRSTRKVDDFKLHIEYHCPENGNRGVYLRGRYEIQVEYEPQGSEDKCHGMGSIYGMLAPKVELPRKPGEWESFDVTLVGR
jgi:3-keto-disaccharide hydrolase